MRVISQDGRTDIPYENFVFGITKDNSIVAIRDTIARPSEIAHGVVATYSTEEKAKKAMEMLREKHLTRMELDGGFDQVNKVYVQPDYWVLPKVFQFPAEEELE